MLRNLSLAIVLLTASHAFGLTLESAVDVAGRDEHFTSYYQIDEPAQGVIGDFPTPETLFQLASAVADTALSLMKWDINHSDWPEPHESYDRRRHFGTWLKDDTHESCMNTRAKVLARSSLVPVRYGTSGCTVKTGEWHEPYAGLTVTEASEMQIDHMVPLKNAYVSGAWKWDARERCAYANFMANEFHLVAVSGHENMSKGDSTPAQWLPPNAAFTCDYLKSWLSVKLIWGLIMNPPETVAIRQAFQRAGCDPSTFRLTAADLARQRRAIQDAQGACH